MSEIVTNIFDHLDKAEPNWRHKTPEVFLEHIAPAMIENLPDGAWTPDEMMRFLADPSVQSAIKAMPDQFLKHTTPVIIEETGCEKHKQEAERLSALITEAYKNGHQKKRIERKLNRHKKRLDRRDRRERRKGKQPTPNLFRPLTVEPRKGRTMDIDIPALIATFHRHMKGAENQPVLRSNLLKDMAEVYVYIVRGEELHHAAQQSQTKKKISLKALFLENQALKRSLDPRYELAMERIQNAMSQYSDGSVNALNGEDVLGPHPHGQTGLAEKFGLLPPLSFSFDREMN